MKFTNLVLSNTSLNEALILIFRSTSKEKLNSEFRITKREIWEKKQTRGVIDSRNNPTAKMEEKKTKKLILETGNPRSSAARGS